MQLKVDSDDFVFKQFDGTEVFKGENGGDFDIVGAGLGGVTITSTGQITANEPYVEADTAQTTSTTDGSLQTDEVISC